MAVALGERRLWGIRRSGLPDILKRADSHAPLADNPKLRDKGFLLSSIPNGQEDTPAFLGGLSEGLMIQALGVDPKKPDTTRYAIWDPEKVKLDFEPYHFIPNLRAKEDARTRARYLEKLGHETIVIDCPDQTMLIKISKREIIASPAVNTSQPIPQL